MSNHDDTIKPTDSVCQEISEESEIDQGDGMPRRQWAGWICLHRKILDHPRWKEDKWLRLWITLLLLATHTWRKRKFGNDVITLLPGQLVTGRGKLEELTEIPETTLDRMLQKMVDEHEIGQVTIKGKGRLIHILQWERYQMIGHENGQSSGKGRAKVGQSAGSNNNAPFGGSIVEGKIIDLRKPAAGGHRSSRRGRLSNATGGGGKMVAASRPLCAKCRDREIVRPETWFPGAVCAVCWSADKGRHPTYDEYTAAGFANRNAKPEGGSQ